MSDLICRQEAINLLKEYIVNPNQVISEHEDDVYQYNNGLLTAIQVISDMKSRMDGDS